MNSHVERYSQTVVVLSGNTHRPSKSRSLAHHLGDRLAERTPVNITRLDLVDAGRELGSAVQRQELGRQALGVLEAVETADALIVVAPIYKGSYPGLFKHLIDFVDPLALVGRPVLLGATGGGQRHALAVEHQFRPLFGFFSALTVPSAVYASDGDFVAGLPADGALLERAGQAVDQLATLLAARPARAEPAAAVRFSIVANGRDQANAG